ncbi:MAG: hypothetical protein ABMA02_11295, partial [Saprospiraceae bacterium]
FCGKVPPLTIHNDKFLMVKNTAFSTLICCPVFWGGELYRQYQSGIRTDVVHPQFPRAVFDQ